MSKPYETTADSKVKLPSMFYYTKTVHHDVYDRISPTRPELSAKGKNVLVTGGGTGIGKSIAISFAQAGAESVSIVGRRKDRLESAVQDIRAAAISKTTTVQYECVDLMDHSEVDNKFEKIASKVGKIDILVSNAASLPELGPVAGYNVKELMSGFNLNVLSSFNAIQAFLKVASAAPQLLNISSSIAHIAPMPGTCGYGISKAANLKMVDYFAAENEHLHVVHLQPGTCETEMSAKVGVKAPDTVELPGAFCVWLASNEAKFLKSKFVWSNWDVDELMAEKENIVDSRLFTWHLDGVPM